MMIRVARVGNEIIVVDKDDQLEFARELDRDELLAAVKEAIKQGAQDLSAFKYKSE
ncbi:hypothetical protein [Shouchella clausii]|uniref:hypothetical protein n=1 Tax=Shouchella clausii TaxID=79880 RepID=UPI00226C9105|nr:hypothetical protein [Shouchella clausii]MCY1105848.1 hypothetical protein [Shouchella clausii]